MRHNFLLLTKFLFNVSVNISRLNSMKEENNVLSTIDLIKLNICINEFFFLFLPYYFQNPADSILPIFISLMQFILSWNRTPKFQKPFSFLHNLSYVSNSCNKINLKASPKIINLRFFFFSFNNITK